MRKWGVILCVAVLSTLLCACSADNVNKPESQGNSETEPAALSVADYFPANENTRLTYQGEGNEYASYAVYTDYAKDDRLQQRISSGGTDIARVVEVTKDHAAVILAQGEVYYRQNMLDMADSTPEILLKMPLEAGTGWIAGGGRIRTITGVGVQVETPAGIYDAIEVTTEGPYGKTVDYYAENVGLIKTMYVSEGGSVTSILAQIEDDVPLMQTIRFYYPKADIGKIGYIDRNVLFYTNDISRVILAEAYKEPPAGSLGQVFSSGTQINSLYLNRDGMVYIDLNKAFQKEMNTGATYEQMILQSVANTFGHYYGVPRVMLTVDGQPYESGHIAMQPGEYLTVDDERVSPAMARTDGE